MRSSQFLLELIETYNNNPQLLDSRYRVVSETKESFARRTVDSMLPIVLNDTPNGSFWAITEDESTYWLLPEASFQLNEFNYKTLEVLFRCHGYQEGYYTRFKLRRPAQLRLVLDTQQLEQTLSGILEFEGTPPKEELGKRLLELECLIIDIEQFLQQNLVPTAHHLSPPATQLKLVPSEIKSDFISDGTNSLDKLKASLNESWEQHFQENIIHFSKNFSDQVEAFLIQRLEILEYHLSKLEESQKVLRNLSQISEKRNASLQNEISTLQGALAIRTQPETFMENLRSLEGRLYIIESNLHELRQQKINEKGHLQLWWKTGIIGKSSKRYMITAGVLAGFLYCFHWLTRIDLFKLFLITVILYAVFLVTKDLLLFVINYFNQRIRS